ncbi:hypothetical protein AMS68_001906 [Peltaster fructicola]|uniref:Uncharacterized protein n=1 Tax=Peltaster fructicola TaxID=286661 RepID=A0A6H0XP35_9PEZI|nr:hypothetical protein AMS68_001906 [Peltaster fructicola]
MVESVPESVSVDNMTGTYNMEKKISDDPQNILKLQGVSWVVRTAISYSAVKMSLNQYTDDDGLIHLDMTTESTGGLTNTEERTMAWQFKEANDKVFGEVKSRSRIIKFSELPADLPAQLKQGWDKEIEEGNVFQNYVESLKNGWNAHQLWGFGVKDGARRHMRKVVVTKGDQVESITMYYDWAE